MICAHNNVITHYDVTLDIPSNIITYCDVIIVMGQNVVSTPLSIQKVVHRMEFPLEIWVWKFHSKQVIAWHKMLNITLTP